MRRISRSYKIAICFLAAFACVPFCFSGFLEEKRPLRLPVNNSPLVIDPENRPAFIENNCENGRIWAIRKKIVSSEIDPAVIAAVSLLEDLPYIIDNGQQFESRNPAFQPSPVLAFDGVTSHNLLAVEPAINGEALDVDGNPLRWHLPDNVLYSYSKQLPWMKYFKSMEKVTQKAAPVIAGKNGYAYYRTLVENFANKFSLSVPLVLAIIYSESNFSPGLVSSKSAMGLMQLLPSTASGEVHRFLYGQKGQVSYEDLRVPETNIRYGTAYLHILFNRYFLNVRDRDVRETCAIAAYNLGPNRFLRLYGSTPEAAVEKINSFSQEEFYNDLPMRLPARETRYFVDKVRRMKNHYAGAN